MYIFYRRILVAFFLLQNFCSVSWRNIVNLAYRTSVVFNIRELLRFNARDLLKTSLNACFDLNVGVLNIYTFGSGLTIYL